MRSAAATRHVRDPLEVGRAAGGRGSPRGCRRAPTSSGSRSNGPTSRPSPSWRSRTSCPGRGRRAARARRARPPQRLGDDVVMLERDDRQLDAGEPGRPRETTGPPRSRRAPPDLARRRRTCQPPRARSSAVTRALRRIVAPRGGAPRERVRHARWVDVAVGRQVGRREDAVGSTSGNSSRRAPAATISIGTSEDRRDRRARCRTRPPGPASSPIRTLPHSVEVDRLAGLRLERPYSSTLDRRSFMRL